MFDFRKVFNNICDGIKKIYSEEELQKLNKQAKETIRRMELEKSKKG